MPLILKRNDHCRGVTLVEVLVAILILSLGMLGIAGLQTTTTQFQLGSRIRSMVAPMLADIASRVRSNADVAGRNAATDFPGVSSYQLVDDWATQQTDTLSISKDCETGTVDCTGEERADYDMAVWRRKLRTSMPSGAALLTGDRADGFAVTFMWFDKGQNDKGRADSSILVKAPVCSTVAETAGSNRMAQQNCCPVEADAPVGVRCNRFTFVP